MFRDTKEELQRLEDQLLEAENADDAVVDEEAEFLAEIEELVGNGQEVLEEDLVYNNDHTDRDPEDLSQELLTPKKEKLTGLIIAALLLFTAILGILIWWIVQFPPEFWKTLWTK